MFSLRCAAATKAKAYWVAEKAVRLIFRLLYAARLMVADAEAAAADP